MFWVAKEKGTNIYRTSRLSYSFYYFMILIILAIVGYIWIKGLYLDGRVLTIAILFCLILVKMTEVQRLTHHYDIKKDGLEKVEGIFVRRHKKLNYGSISQIHLTQTPLGKLFNVGTVELAQFSDTVRTEIKNINKPKKFIKELGERMHRIEEKKLKPQIQ